MANPLPPTLEEQLAGQDGSQAQPIFNHEVVTKDLLNHIAKNLKDQISQSIKDMKDLSQKNNNEETSGSNNAIAAVPISIVLPQDVGATPDTAQKRRGRRTTTTVIGEISVSYEIPQFCAVNNIDLDNLPIHGKEASDANNRRQFSFAERLNNWSLEQRERTNGMRDTYYHHIRSGASFRSIAEVINFLMYEVQPAKPQSKTKQEAEAMDASGTPGASSSGKMKKRSCGVAEKKKLEKKAEATASNPDASGTPSALSGKKEKKSGGDAEKKKLEREQAKAFKILEECRRNMENKINSL